MRKLTSSLPRAAGALAIFAGALIFAATDGPFAETSVDNAGGFQIAADGDGNIRLPEVDYRKDWVSLGPWAVAADEGTSGSQGIHAVYTQRESVEAFRTTGKFPDGAVLIKELFSTVTQDMTTGTVSRAHETQGWFVMIKDETGRFPGNKLWGDGWGWAFFGADDRTKTTTKDYAAECKDCHIPAESNDWIYTEGYPVLRGQ